jgi:predicted  nucleic acid-binding Zn-ribbon protein
MSRLSILIELQTIHNNLQTIQRDLSSLPPDLANLENQLKVTSKKLEEISKGLTTNKELLSNLDKELQEASKAEINAQASLKKVTHKIQYTAAIRRLDECQKQVLCITRPAKEAKTQINDLEKSEIKLKEQQVETQKQFDGLKAIFLSEHVNQLGAQTTLQARMETLEGMLEPVMLNKFKRLLQQRVGRAVVTINNGVCDGCSTKLRVPLIAQLRELDVVFCESCQRILYDPSNLSNL